MVGKDMSPFLSIELVLPRLLKLLGGVAPNTVDLGRATVGLVPQAPSDSSTILALCCTGLGTYR